MYFIYSLRLLVILFTSKQYSTQICSDGFCWFLFCKQVQCKIMKKLFIQKYKPYSFYITDLHVCYTIICSWFNYNEHLLIDKYFEKKLKLEHEHTRISYINKLFEFKIHTNLNSLDKTLRFLVRFWMDGRAAKLIFANIV